MIASEIRAIIDQAADFCIQRDASGFASLFTTDAQLFVSGQLILGKDQIEQITQNYFATCTQIKIEIQRILVEDDGALIEWIWSDEQKNGVANAIVLDFHQGLIQRWREYYSQIPT